MILHSMLCIYFKLVSAEFESFLMFENSGVCMCIVLTSLLCMVFLCEIGQLSLESKRTVCIDIYTEAEVFVS
jgi:hypothetical protein